MDDSGREKGPDRKKVKAATHLALNGILVGLVSALPMSPAPTHDWVQPTRPLVERIDEVRSLLQLGQSQSSAGSDESLAQWFNWRDHSFSNWPNGNFRNY
ncbi:MAG: hypothetical protein JWL84_4343 [Rhodospirillales bacterium]|jgi:hypothetical protein|nr:hypothetical protein [Rhodospirillales bacterium]